MTEILVRDGVLGEEVSCEVEARDEATAEAPFVCAVRADSPFANARFVAAPAGGTVLVSLLLSLLRHLQCLKRIQMAHKQNGAFASNELFVLAPKSDRLYDSSTTCLLRTASALEKVCLFFFFFCSMLKFQYISNDCGFLIRRKDDNSRDAYDCVCVALSFSLLQWRD